jgi:hypothetical protein
MFNLVVHVYRMHKAMEQPLDEGLISAVASSGISLPVQTAQRPANGQSSYDQGCRMSSTTILSRPLMRRVV